MSNIEIKSGDLSEVISSASKAESAMRASLDVAKALVSSSSGYDQTWTGESKDSYLMYLGIVKQYHEDLAKCVKSYKKAVSELQKDIDSFDSSKMGEIRGI